MSEDREDLDLAITRLGIHTHTVITVSDNAQNNENAVLARQRIIVQFIPAEANGPFGHPSWRMSTARVSPTRPERWTIRNHQLVITFPRNSISSDQTTVNVASCSFRGRNDKWRVAHRRKIPINNQQFDEMTLLQRPSYSYNCPTSS